MATYGEDSFTEKEWEKLMKVVDHLEDEVMLKTFLATGARREDVCHGNVRKRKKGKVVRVTTGIKIDNIDLEEHTITFTEHKKDRIKTVPIPEELSLLIRKLINSRGKQQSDYLITYSGKTAWSRLQKYCVKAGIDKRPIHAIRATCVKFCKKKGWTDEQISALTGDTTAVISKHYSTPSVSEMQELVREKPIL